MRSTIDRNWRYELRSMRCPASLARACTQFSCSCLKRLRKTTCVICNLCAAPKVDMASRRYFDGAYLVRGSREKAWITCSKLDKKIRLMTRQYSSSRDTEALQPFTHSPLAGANLVAVRREAHHGCLTRSQSRTQTPPTISRRANVAIIEAVLTSLFFSRWSGSR